MGEERQKSRKWIWWAVILLLVLYPLSTGPANWIYCHFEGNALIQEEIRAAYRPLGFLCAKSATINAVINWYHVLWFRILGMP